MAVAALERFLAGKQRLIVLTGAGMSTESGIPDYRSPGRPPYKPIMHAAFTGDPQIRRRYWSRSMLGFSVLSSSHPNAGHLALAKAEEANMIQRVITQNVDELHQRAGSKNVVELHGSIHKVGCLSCPAEVSRRELQDTLVKLNPQFAVAPSGLQRPDGDIDSLVDHSTFQVPPCLVCGGVLKPAIVFFGGTVPAPVSNLSAKLAQSCDGLLVLGTSLTTFSAFRLVKYAIRDLTWQNEGENFPPAEVMIVNDGPTRADELMRNESFRVGKIEARIGALLSAVFGIQEKQIAEPRNVEKERAFHRLVPHED